MTKKEVCFHGLSTVNVELSSRCNKRCWMCGRRKMEQTHPHLCNWCDMPLNMVKSIARQLPPNIIVQLHNNGESLMHPQFGEAVKQFTHQYRCLDTNGKLLIDKAYEIIDNLDSITISVFQDDPEQDEQYEIVKQFLSMKQDKQPLMVYRLLGNVEPSRWEKLPGIIVTRLLHSPDGSFSYSSSPTRPEIGVCLDLLHHLVVDRRGNVSICVRFDPHAYGFLGNLMNDKLVDLWNSPKRKRLISEHFHGNRKGNRLCKSCEYWGCPTGWR